MFEVGDIVKGRSDSPYSITNASMTKGIVKEVKGSDIKVKILKHTQGSEGVFLVEAEHFEKIGHAETFERKKFLELLKESKEKAAEYLSDADLSDADLSDADLSRADLSDADLSRADLSCADLRGADLRRADLRRADLRGANLSQCEGLLDAINFMEAHFDRNEEGYIVYKTFGSDFKAPDTWKIEPGEILTEVCNPERTCNCGCGINVAPYTWVKSRNNGSIYKLLIRYEWLAGVVVPYNTDGKIRCSRAEIIGEVE